MTWQEEYSVALSRELDRRRRNDSKYSMRDLAKDIGLAVGSVSGILKNKKILAADRAVETLTRLNLPEHERIRILVKMGKPITRTSQPIRVDDFIVLRDWLHLAVLHFFDLEEFNPTAKNISRRLGVREAEIQSAIGNLIERNFLKRNADRLVRTDVNWTAGDGPPSEVIREFHHANLKVAGRALEAVPMDKRYFGSVTFCANPDNLANVHDEIRAFSNRLAELMMDRGPLKEVFRMNLNLFPLNFGDLDASEA